ncbi:methyltransferase [Algicola sagamiensis]|uniref:methyltransferase n=1 Tax=Algicola sagamiensis TaxID=163869 RepID=UPI000371CD32|nr:methyltransferase [Algicola sagamiensis]
MLTNANQLLERNLDVFEQKKLLVVNCPDDAGIEMLMQETSADITVIALDWRSFEVASKTCQQTFFSHQLPADCPSHDAILIYYPKSKQEFEYIFHMAAPVLQENADVYVVGDNKGGVKSAQKQLAGYCASIGKVDAARHCILYHGQLTEAVPEFRVEAWFKQYDVSIGERALQVYSLPGVFSHGELDIATRLLLEEQTDKPRGRVLDFGCGAGVITAWLASRNENATVEAIDVSALALASTEKTLNANEVDAKVYPSNGWSQVKGVFNGIYTNPPFHKGVKTDYNVTESFIRGCKAHLKSKGQLHLVANSFLKYPPIIEDTIGTCHIVAKNKGFQLYRASYFMR